MAIGSAERCGFSGRHVSGRDPDSESLSPRSHSIILIDMRTSSVLSKRMSRNQHLHDHQQPPSTSETNSRDFCHLTKAGNDPILVAFFLGTQPGTARCRAVVSADFFALFFKCSTGVGHCSKSCSCGDEGPRLPRAHWHEPGSTAPLQTAPRHFPSPLQPLHSRTHCSADVHRLLMPAA